MDVSPGSDAPAQSGSDAKVEGEDSGKNGCGVETGVAPAPRDASHMGEEAAEPAADATLHVEKAMQAKEHGAELYKQQKFIEARDAWVEALSGIPSEHDNDLGRMKLSLRLNLAQVCLQLKDNPGVVLHATEALKLDPESPKAFYRRGLGQGAMGEVKAAASDLQKAARIEPRNMEVRKKYEEFKKRAIEVEEREEQEQGPPEHNLALLPRIFLDVAVGSKPPVRMVFALYKDTVPKTADNFRQLCTGEHEGLTARGKPFHYKGSLLHRIIPGLMVQGGDFENTNGTGGESIYGRRFKDEAFLDKHTRRGLLAMANDGINTNGSNFFVSFAAAEHLDKHHVIFGELVEGWELLDALEKLETNAECRPLVDCVIADCGELLGAQNLEETIQNTA